MKLKTTLALGALALTLSGVSLPVMADDAVEKLPAFPGAEGYGRYVTGGRGGKVYCVKNLNDSGDGSLRWALSQKGPKIIVFKVSGTIHLKSGLGISANTTIAGQSAPGDGICVADYPVSVTGNNVIVRYMRFRLGNKYVQQDGADGWDGLNGMDREGIMIDHCSVSWSIDECCSFLGNKNTTVQWSIVSQSLVNSGHSKGAHGYGGNWGGSGASFHHNLLAHHGSRTPRLGPRPTTQLDERMDMRNNVIYNFGGNGCYGGEGMKVNIVNNYYKPGPGSPTNNRGMRIAGVGIRTYKYIQDFPAYAPALHLWGKFYVDGNVNSKYSQVTGDNWTYGMYNQIDASGCDGTYTSVTKDTIKITEPIPFVYTTTHSAEDAYEKVLAYAGASLRRDSHDEMIVNDTRDGKASHTGSGLSKGFINSQDDNRPADAPADWSAWPVLESKNAPTDTDGDGIPDIYEENHGLNPDDPSDAASIASNGYSNIENYLNGLVATITNSQEQGGEKLGEIQTVGSDPVPTEYELSPFTCSDDNWGFSNGFSITVGNGYATGSGCGITGIKYSRNSTFTINIPEGVSITKAEFTGYSNSDTGTAYLELFGTDTFAASDYVFPSRKGSKTASYTVNLSKPATSTLPMRYRDNQVVMIIKLFTGTASGVEKVTTVTVGDKPTSIYTLDGRRVNGDIELLGKGIYIVNGRKIFVK
ncbi:pectate lyase family protein [Xylanibacter muris]|uniref:pectate lyase family protein n=1 Tax=Xylanibacter muris TaxID=2736290 RepID=UPI001C12DB9F|nr:hypothetical protein [Xylanibacter muris]